MSILVSFLFFLSFTSVLSVKDDETALLKFKQQIGDPEFLSSWVEGFDFCSMSSPSESSPLFLVCDYHTTGQTTGLFMARYDFIGPFPDAICSLTDLEYFFIDGIPGMYGQIPSCITELINLRRLGITNTSLSGPVPSFYNSKNLVAIQLSHNYLSGKIPSALSTLPNLNELDLSFNFLTGTVPPELVHGTSPTLLLNNNNLTGELPKCYVYLGVIDVGNNQLRGDASFLFGNNSIKVALANNEFEFDLSFIEFSDNLFYLDISHNKIYGHVPYSFATATGLGYVDLSFNKLCGKLPQGQFMWRYNFANNECLYGIPLPSFFDSAPVPSPVFAPPFPPISAPPF